MRGLLVLQLLQHAWVQQAGWLAGYQHDGWCNSMPTNSLAGVTQCLQIRWHVPDKEHHNTWAGSSATELNRRLQGSIGDRATTQCWRIVPRVEPNTCTATQPDSGNPYLRPSTYWCRWLGYCTKCCPLQIGQFRSLTLSVMPTKAPLHLRIG